MHSQKSPHQVLHSATNENAVTRAGEKNQGEPLSDFGTPLKQKKKTTRPLSSSSAETDKSVASFSSNNPKDSTNNKSKGNQSSPLVGWTDSSPIQLPTGDLNISAEDDAFLYNVAHGISTDSPQEQDSLTTDESQSVGNVAEFLIPFIMSLHLRWLGETLTSALSSFGKFIYFKYIGISVQIVLILSSTIAINHPEMNDGNLRQSITDVMTMLACYVSQWTRLQPPDCVAHISDIDIKRSHLTELVEGKLIESGVFEYFNVF